MKNLVFATHNQNKLKEIKKLLPDTVLIKNLEDINVFEDIPETGKTLNENALLKAQYVKTHYAVDCFADDTGLEVEALGGQPGVRSARFAGLQKRDKDNVDKLLKLLVTTQNRKARFRTVIALVLGEKEYFFEGVVNGEIAEEQRGGNGFGYDPIFIPKSYNTTFAEMSLDKKNAISHRAIATNKLVTFLSHLD